MRFSSKILTSTLFKIGSLNGLSVTIKIIIGVISSKFLALFVGPSGIALVGNLRNFLTVIESVSTLGFQNGIVKYVTENNKNNQQNSAILSTLFFTLLFVTGTLSGLLLILANYLNGLIFNNQADYVIVFQFLAIVLPFYAGSLYLISVINGLQQFKQVIFINIIGNIIGLLITVFLVYFYSVFGALLAIVAAPTVLFFVSLYFLYQEIDVLKQISWEFFDVNIIKNLSHYFLMALVSGILGPLVYLAIRNHVIQTIGLKEAGFCEALNRISTYYFMFVNTLITLYYFPKLVLAKTNQETKNVFFNYYKNVLLLFSVGLITIYFLRNLIIQFLFSLDFAPVLNLFLWQLIGDFFKAASLILGFQFFAKKMTKDFIFTEILSLTILYFSSIYFIDVYKIEGFVMAHAFTYVIYFLVLAFWFRKIFYNHKF